MVGGRCRLALELRVAERTRLLDVEPFLQTASVEEMTARRDHGTVHVLVADGTDVVVLLQLCVACRGEALDLVYSVSPEQEALPTQLGSEPDVVVRVDQDDGAAHHAPLPKHRL